MKDLYQFIAERTLGGGWKEEVKSPYYAQILSFDEPSQYGIDGGRISKLYITKAEGRKGQTVICNYDRGWDGGEPKLDAKAQKFYDELIKKYN